MLHLSHGLKKITRQKWRKEREVENGENDSIIGRLEAGRRMHLRVEIDLGEQRELQLPFKQLENKSGSKSLSSCPQVYIAALLGGKCAFPLLSKQFSGEGSHGVILFLYSLIFSRTFERYVLQIFTQHFLWLWGHINCVLWC